MAPGSWSSGAARRMDHGHRSGGNQAVAWIPVAEMLEHIARREGIDRVML